MRLKRQWLSWLKRRWLLVLLIGAFLIFVALNLDQAVELAAALVRGQPQWVLGAVLAQTAYYFLYALEYKLALATVEVASRVIELIPVLFASIFVRTVVPTGGVSGAAIFVDDAARRGQSAPRTAEGALLVLTLDLVTLMPLLALAVTFLALENALVAYQIVGSVILLLFLAGLIAALLLGRWEPEVLRRLLGLVQQGSDRVAEWLGHPGMLPSDWADRNASDFTRAANDVATHRRDLKRTVGVAVAAQLVNLVTLEAVGRAYRQTLGLGTVVAAFTLEAVFSIVTVVPNGLVVAEAVMVAVLTSLGVGIEVAILITIVYRGLSVWLPLLVGFLFLRYVRTFREGR